MASTAALYERMLEFLWVAAYLHIGKDVDSAHLQAAQLVPQRVQLSGVLRMLRVVRLLCMLRRRQPLLQLVDLGGMQQLQLAHHVLGVDHLHRNTCRVTPPAVPAPRGLLA